MSVPSDRNAADTAYADLLGQMPAQVRIALPEAPWRLELLWRLQRPVEDVQVAELSWLLDLPLWQLEGRRFQVRPHDVAARPDRFPDHYRRVMASDLAHPIHLARRSGRWSVLDGFHRLLKAELTGRRTLPAMRLSDADLALTCGQEKAAGLPANSQARAAD
jgi:hypothetical protein